MSVGKYLFLYFIPALLTAVTSVLTIHIRSQINIQPHVLMFGIPQLLSLCVEMRKSVIYGLNSVLKYSLTYNLILNAVFLGSIAPFQHIVSVLYSVMYYLNAFIMKWDMHKLCRLPKRLPSGQIFLWTASLMISSSFPLSFTEHPDARHCHSNIERLFKQKWEKERQHWAFTFMV